MRRLGLFLGAAVTAVVFAGCPGAHDGWPTTACVVDSDCYIGEKCMSSSVCVPSGSTDLAAPTPVEDMAEPLPGGDS